MVCVAAAIAGSSCSTTAAAVVVIHVLWWRGGLGRTFLAALSVVVPAASAAVVSGPQLPHEHVPGGGVPRIQLQGPLKGVAGIVGVAASNAVASAAIPESNVGRGEANMALGPSVIESDAGFGVGHRCFRLGGSPQFQPTGNHVAQQELLVQYGGTPERGR